MSVKRTLPVFLCLLIALGVSANEGLFDSATAAAREGDLAAMQKIYERILAAEPENVRALNGKPRHGAETTSRPLKPFANHSRSSRKIWRRSSALATPSHGRVTSPTHSPISTESSRLNREITRRAKAALMLRCGRAMRKQPAPDSPSWRLTAGRNLNCLSRSVRRVYSSVNRKRLTVRSTGHCSLIPTAAPPLRVEWPP